MIKPSNRQSQGKVPGLPVHNPFTEIAGFNCIACSPTHRFGLKLQFRAIHDTVVTHVQAADDFSGIGGILHGGIQATILDEVMWWTVFHFQKRFCVTQQMNLDFKATVKTGVPLLARGKIISVDKNRIRTQGEICAAQRVLVSAEATYFLPNQRLFARSQGMHVSTLPNILREFMPT